MGILDARLFLPFALYHCRTDINSDRIRTMCTACTRMSAFDTKYVNINCQTIIDSVLVCKWKLLATKEDIRYYATVLHHR